MSNRYCNSNQFLYKAERVIPLGTQTFSKGYTQYPKGMAPLFIKRGFGGSVWDIDDNQYVDLVCGLLPVVLGYCDPDVDNAIKRQLDDGITFSLPSVLEAELAERLVNIIPSAEMVRFGKNGTDATSAAIRLARAYTGRDYVIALGYHGWQDWYIGATVRNKGVPNAVCSLTHKLPFNDINAVKEFFKIHPDNIAAIIVEPFPGEYPLDGFLEELREIADQYGSLLIFDEVITGFRFSLGGAQELFGVKPDISAFGKALGNGMPISAVVGRADVMLEMEEIFYSGTFGGEALSLAAAIAVIDKMQSEPVIENLWEKGKYLSGEVRKKVDDYGLSHVINVAGAAPWTIINFNDHVSAESAAIRTLYMIEMLNNGVLTTGTHNICYAHDKSDIQAVLNAYDNALSSIAEQLQSRTLLKTLEKLDASIIRPVFSVRGK